MTAKSTCLPIALSTLFVLGTACSPARDEPVVSASTGADPSEGPTNRIEIPQHVRRALGITFAKVEARRVEHTVRVPGAFELQPLARREYRMALPGRVELLVDQYEKVDVGQVLFRFQSPAWPELLHEIIVGEQAIDTALAEIEVARAKSEEAGRKLELLRERLAALARADFKQADLELQAAELEAGTPRMAAELRLAETRLVNARRTREHALHRAATAAGLGEHELEEEIVVGGTRVPRYSTIDWVDVRAVHAGVVEMLAVTDGAFVETPDLVVSLVDPGKLRFRALALQADLPRLVGQIAARIVPPRTPGIEIGDAVTAAFSIGLEAHPEERTLTLLATPEVLTPWMRAGVSAFLEVELDATAAPALAIPRSAIVQDGLMYVFFRRDPADPNKAIRVEADMGVSDGRWVVLESGVMRDDEIVLSGAYELKLAMEQRGASSGAGHFHADGSFHDE